MSAANHAGRAESAAMRRARSGRGLTRSPVELRDRSAAPGAKSVDLPVTEWFRRSNTDQPGHREGRDRSDSVTDRPGAHWASRAVSSVSTGSTVAASEVVEVIP
jgi:hypothetical protein